MHTLAIRWTVVILVPALTLLYLALSPAQSPQQHLIHGIVLACEAVFLFKFVLFALIGHHLRQEKRQQRQTCWLLLPVAALIGYTVYYFMA